MPTQRQKVNGQEVDSSTHFSQHCFYSHRPKQVFTFNMDSSDDEPLVNVKKKKKTAAKPEAVKSSSATKKKRKRDPEPDKAPSSSAKRSRKLE
jgi:hypothetical protein